MSERLTICGICGFAVSGSCASPAACELFVMRRAVIRSVAESDAALARAIDALPGLKD